MLDIKFIIENQKLVEEGIAKKGLSVDIPALIALHLDINKLKTSSQALAEEKAEQFDQIRFRGRTSGNHRQKQSPRRRTEG